MFKYLLIALALIISGTAVHYITPQTDIVRIVGVEIKRVDVAATNGVKTTGDLYFIQTEAIDSNRPTVYRNEDNWLYFKWNSADVQSRGQSLSANKDIVAISHYGWRFALFSIFPNVLSIEQAKAEDASIPILFFSMLTGVWGALIFGYIGLSRRFKRLKSPDIT